MSEKNRVNVMVRRASRELVADVFKATKHFDQLQQHKYGNEIRRLATSMSSYITEGTSRQSVEEQNEFLLLGYESMVELLGRLAEVRDLTILPVKYFIVLKFKVDDLAKKINLVSQTPNNK